MVFDDLGSSKSAFSSFFGNCPCYFILVVFFYIFFFWFLLNDRLLGFLRVVITLNVSFLVLRLFNFILLYLWFRFLSRMLWIFNIISLFNCILFLVISTILNVWKVFISTVYYIFWRTRRAWWSILLTRSAARWISSVLRLFIAVWLILRLTLVSILRLIVTLILNNSCLCTFFCTTAVVSFILLIFVLLIGGSSLRRRSRIGVWLRFSCVLVLIWVLCSRFRCSSILARGTCFIYWF